MIRYYPMARATSLLGGSPVVYDLTQISSMTACTPAYPPMVRDVETVARSLRRKNFGTRPTAELGFQVAHSRVRNVAARYEESSGNLLRSPLDLSASPWAGIASVARSAERDPTGTLNAWRVTDGSNALATSIYQTTLSGGTAARLSWYFRADTAHAASGELQAVPLHVQADAGWQHGAHIYSPLTTYVAAFTCVFYPVLSTDFALTGNVDLYLPDCRSIIPVSGTDEEILSDLHDKLCSDDWSVELTLDGGLTWRTVLLQEYEKAPIKEKWIGHEFRFSLECSAPIFARPPTLDGRW